MAEILHYCVTTPQSVAKTRSTSESAKRGKIVTLSQGLAPYRHVSSLVNAVAFKHLGAFKRACFVEIVTLECLGMLVVLCCITLWVRFQIRIEDYLEMSHRLQFFFFVNGYGTAYSSFLIMYVTVPKLYFLFTTS